MNKKIASLVLSAALLISSQVPHTSFSQAKAESVDSLVDITPNHWAYDAVKLVTQDLGVMSPKTSTRFMGNDITTRYEVAQVFYNLAKKLEASSGKNLKITGDKRQTNLTDLDPTKKSFVDSVINEYGIMQAMPGNKFMGNEKMSRYELAYELDNYIKLLIKKVGKVSLAGTNKADSFTDIKEEHWATPSIKSVVNSGCQVMSGYPDNTFKGFSNLSRYELAAVLNKFVDCVNKYLIPVTAATPVATPVPTAVPTVVPTPEPTATPEPEVTPEPMPTKKPLSTTDLQLGGSFRISSVDKNPGDTVFNGQNVGFIYGPSGKIDFRFGGFQLGFNGDYSMYSKVFNPATTVTGLSRVNAGGDLGWRIFGTESDEDASLYVGVGAEYLQWMGSSYTYPAFGPRGRVALEIPLGSWFGIFAENTFSYFPMDNAKFVNDPTWKNDLFTGITIPSSSGFAIQLGYRDVRYVLQDKATMFGDIGAQGNLRFRF